MNRTIRRERAVGWVWRAAIGLTLCAATLGACRLAAAQTATAPTTAATTAPAAPGIYSIVTNPAEDCATQMNIGWHADLALADCSVTYTEKSDTAWARAVTVKGRPERCDIFDGISSKTPAGADFNEQAVFLDYGVTLTGLRPDTQYVYRVSAGADGPVSPIHRFKTAGASEFSFAWISDFHAYTPLPGRLKNAVAVLNAAVAVDPGVDFVFSTGDIVAWGGSYSFWKNLYEQDFIRDYMFACVIGNHDDMTRKWSTRHDYFRVANNFPANGYRGQEGVCYWFVYGDVLFITLNNEAMKKGAEAEQAAKDWAAGVIRAQKGKYRRIVLSEHYQWFDGRNGKTSWYANWKDFCDEHGVTLALSGNNHVYERTHPLLRDQVVPAGQGTVYMEAPSSDGERGVEAGPLTANADKLAYTWSSHARLGNGVKTVGCVLVKVAPNGITTKLVYLDDETKEFRVADEYTLPVAPASPPSAVGGSHPK